ncbi:uroporphyrinogen III synthase HEM4 [Hyphomicrobium denitrificans 1NES1]|uniref:Uroporphyrinogen-III synthase n=1 Tax=Hyphomicrobium denitrificans 1NES1 TaxID=670307 RepID=N0B8J2_9HYPH|nr:uroporphyrinogen-III synthase [Hyphomicrobium denitrificans]AGK59934.1 uroporphyrinogen III synthase HEM4 [Hyphomicrobium denitrificans 1NES1]
MHVLVTRPKGDGEKLKAQLEQLGWEVSLEPLIRIVPNEIPPSAIDGASTLIVTSRNALKTLSASAALVPATMLPLMAVGPGTAALALELGFKDVFEGPGTGAELAPEIVRKSKADGGTFVYLAGDKLAFDLPAVLTEQGVNIRRVVAYRSVAAETLSPRIAEALREGVIDVVVLMSPKTAETWASVAPDVAKPNDLSGISYACISEAVANVLRLRLGTQNIIIADRPNLEEIFIVLKRLAARPEAE